MAVQGAGACAVQMMFEPYLWYAQRRLRAPSQLARLAQLEDPEAFFDQMFLAAGRNLAVASGFLSQEIRHEGKIAFLCCRALDAHEDLNRDPDVAARRLAETADYLQGKSASPPPPPSDPGSRETDQLEVLIASRLPWLRQALASLPAPRRDRIFALIDDLAWAMIAHVHSRSRADSPSLYGEQVLGRVVRYALDLLQLEPGATVDPASIGRLCQAINDLRDFHDDAPSSREGAPWDAEVEKALLWLELAEAATVVTSVLRSPGFSRASGPRAAVIYMAATTLKAIAVQASYPLPWLARHPLWGALVGGALGLGYQRVLLQLEQTVLGLLAHLARSWGGAVPSAAPADLKIHGLRQDAFELSLADQHPDPRSATRLKQACRLLKYSILLTSYLPQAPLSSRPQGDSDGQLLMLSDYLMARAFAVIQGAGLSALGLFSRTCATLSEELQEQQEPTDPQGHLAAFLTEVVGSARGIPRAQREQLCARNRDISRALHRRDRRKSLLPQLNLNLFG
jgi:phytoene/squalene synthetase